MFWHQKLRLKNLHMKLSRTLRRRYLGVTFSDIWSPGAFKPNLTTFSHQLLKMQSWGWRLNLGYLPTSVCYLALSNKKVWKEKNCSEHIFFWNSLRLTIFNNTTVELLSLQFIFSLKQTRFEKFHQLLLS